MTDNPSDITYNRHGGNEFSDEAFESIKHRISRQRKRILGYVAVKPDGATCDEAAYALGMLHQTASARFTELKRDKHIVPLIDHQTGKQARRKTKADKTAGVWIAA